MKINDTLSGLLLALFAAAIFIYAGTFPSMRQQIGPALFPQLLAGGFLICAFLLICKGLGQTRTQAWVSPPPGVGGGGFMICAFLRICKGLRQTRTEAWFSLPPWFGERRAVFAYLLVLLSLVFYICACEAL